MAIKKYFKDFKLFQLNIVILTFIQLLSIILEYYHEKYYLSEVFDYQYSLHLSKIQSDISYVFVFVLFLTFVYIFMNTFSPYFFKYVKRYLVYFIIHYGFVIICIQGFGLYHNAFNGAECIPGAIVILIIYTFVLLVLNKEKDLKMLKRL